MPYTDPKMQRRPQWRVKSNEDREAYFPASQLKTSILPSRYLELIGQSGTLDTGGAIETARITLQKAIPQEPLTLNVNALTGDVIGYGLGDQERAQAARSLGMAEIPVIIYYKEPNPDIPGGYHHIPVPRSDFRPKLRPLMSS